MDTPVDYAEESAIVTLNQPETRKALTDLDVVGALVGAIERYNSDPSVCAAILTDADQAFSSGGNLKRMLDPKAGLIVDNITLIMSDELCGGWISKETL